MRRAFDHPLHLLGIAGGGPGLAFGITMTQDSTFSHWALGLTFTSATEMGRRLGLESPDDPGAPHNRGKG